MLTRPSSPSAMSPRLSDYAELRCLSNFSFLRGASHPDELVQRAHALGYRALALTDECSVAGAVRAHLAAKAVNAAAQHAGSEGTAPLQLILGAQFCVQARSSAESAFTLVLLAQTLQGWGNLCAFITRLRRASPKGSYNLTRAGVAGADLRDCLALICPDRQLASPADMASSGWGGDQARASQHAMWPDESLAPHAQASMAQPPDAIDQRLAELGHWALTHFMGRCWIGVEQLRRMDDALWLHRLRQMGARTALPLVAVGDVHMHLRSRKPLQDVLSAIRLGLPLAQCGHALQRSAEQHLRNRLRLAQTFADDLLTQTLAVASRCHFSLDEIRYQYPDEVVPVGATAMAYLTQVTHEGAALRWPQGVPDKVQGLLARELALIGELGYEHYFLTVYDIVRHARKEGILCQGRGSAANSAVCYCLHITEVDPARSSVLFERFISKERNEPPDIDVDFEHERREEVIQYLYRKYGRDRCALTATVISYHARSAIRDVGKALGFDADTLDAIARQHRRFDDGCVQPALLQELGLDVDLLAMQQLMTLVGQILGFPRHLSQHTGGFVLTQGPLSRLVPIENAAMPDRTVIQWDKDDLDAAGLLKVDVLALGMLTAIRRALDFIGQRHGAPMRMQDIPREDPLTYDMICRADTVGVFQIESRAQMSMLPRLKPRCFYDLVIEVAIVRPGPIQGGMVHPYLRRRQKLEAVHYESEALKPALARTLGVPIFQEQVMQIAMLAAGFSPGEADELRRAMAAWRRTGNLAKYHDKIVQGMAANGYTAEFAESIFRQIQGFSEYGFPESHAASFALLVYVSCWLKQHEPAAFLAALLNSQPMGFYTPSQLVQDARRHDVEVRPVDVLHSDWDCTLEPAAAGPAPLDQRGRQAQASQAAQTHRAAAPAAEDGRREPAGPHAVQEASDAGVNAVGQEKSGGRQAIPQMAVRLGLCMVSGLDKQHALRIVQARREAQARAPGCTPWPHAQALAQHARLMPRDMQLLAAADALAGLSGHRRQQMWDAAAWQPAPALLQAAPIDEAPLQLPEAPEVEAVAWDLAATHLSLRTHPMALLRPQLARYRVRDSQALQAVADGQWVRTAGIVTVRQQPPTAGGVTFVSLEDEWGSVQVIVWRHVRDAQRSVLNTARLLAVKGRWQREGEVRNLIAHQLADLSALLAPFATGKSRDFR